MSLNKITYLLVFILLPLSGKAQQFLDKKHYLVDSLKKEDIPHNDIVYLDSILPVYHKLHSDTSRLRVLSFLAENLWGENVWPKYNLLQYNIANRNLMRKGLSIIETATYKIYLGRALNNIGFYYKQKGQIPYALQYYTKSLRVRKELNDAAGIGESYSNLATIYLDQKDYEEAETYLKRALKYNQLSSDTAGMIIVLNKLAIIEKEKRNYVFAQDYEEQSLRLSNQKNDHRGLGLTYLSLGQIFELTEKYDSALSCYLTSLKNLEIVEDKQNITNCQIHIGNLYLLLKKFKEAERYAKGAYKNAQELDYPEQMRDASKLMVDLLSERKMYKEAIAYLQEYHEMKEKVSNAEARQLLMRTKMDAEFGQKAYRDSLKNAEAQQVVNAKLEAELKSHEAERTQRYALYGGIALLIGFSVFVYNRFRVIRKQHALIEKQHSELNRKTLQITDSINYARNIQRALLPPSKFFKNIFNDFLILYKPKDIVSGDFYWFHEINEDKILVVVADCTGHGVPGAFMSILGINVLERTVRVNNLERPDEILTAMNKEIYQSLSRYGTTDVQDGMDMAIMLFDKKQSKLYFSAVFNSLFFLRNQQLTEYKGDIYHIGKSGADKTDFTLIEIDTQPGDTFYLFTDGYCDQKGGPKDMKFFPKLLRDFLVKNSIHDLKTQRDLLDTNFENWKGNNDQVDDVLIFGFRV